MREHVERREPFFSEAARVLRPAGRPFVCELHPHKQHAGTQARFEDPETGELRRVRAHLHERTSFLNAAIAAGLRLARADEWRSPHDPATAPPRLFSAVWGREA